MTETNRESQVTYRTSVERHKRLRTASIERGQQVQEILDDAVDAYLGAPPPKRVAVDRERQALHLSLDSLLDHAAQKGHGWERLRDVVEDLLTTWRKNNR